MASNTRSSKTSWVEFKHTKNTNPFHGCNGRKQYFGRRSYEFSALTSFTDLQDAIGHDRDCKCSTCSTITRMETFPFDYPQSTQVPLPEEQLSRLCTYWSEAYGNGMDKKRILTVFKDEPAWFAAVISHMCNLHLDLLPCDENGPGKLFLYHLLQIINFIHRDIHLFVRMSTTKDSRYDWCGLSFGSLRGVPDVTVKDARGRILVIGEVSHDKPDDGKYELLGELLTVYLKTRFLPCGLILANESLTFISFAKERWFVHKASLSDLRSILVLFELLINAVVLRPVPDTVSPPVAAVSTDTHLIMDAIAKLSQELRDTISQELSDPIAKLSQEFSDLPQRISKAIREPTLDGL